MTRRRRHAWMWLTLLCVVGSLFGCATVRPWEREALADPAMTFGADDDMDRGARHAIDYREGTRGARSAEGGGCGCN